MGEKKTPTPSGGAALGNWPRILSTGFRGAAILWERLRAPGH